jgi:hypothetical protein
MGFYLRKSVAIGPLRLNLSTGGIGASIGVKGLRFGVGPSGTYVHAGLGGLYYRSSLGSRGRSPAGMSSAEEELAHAVLAAQPSEWKEIDSGSVDLMVDASAETVIEQLKRRHKTTYWFMGIAIVGAMVSILLAIQAGMFVDAMKPNPWTAGRIVWAIALGIAVAATIAGAVWGHGWDAISRGGVAFLYEFEENIASAYERVFNVLERISNTSVKYHTWSEANVGEGKSKYHGGATRLIKTTSLAIDLYAPWRVAANVPIPSFSAGQERLCFFPERLVILHGSGSGERIGAVPYQQVQLDVSPSRFTLASASAPGGTQLLGHTWQYVNKNGSPDRRFKNNRQLAVIACENILFCSESGLREQVMHSSPGLGKELADALRHLGDELARLPAASSAGRAGAKPVTA